MTRISIRFRLTIWYSTVLLLGLVLFGAGMWTKLERRLIAGVDATLAQRVQGLKTYFEVEGETEVKDREQLEQELSEFAREVPEGALIQLRDSTGRLLLPFPENSGFPNFPSGSLGYRTMARDGRSYRVLASRIEYGGRQYDVSVASELDGVRAVMRDFRRFLFLMVPAVLALACLGGYWISRRALAPVDEITRVAKSIGLQNLAERLAVPQTGDEIQRMSEAWNEVLERLDLAVTRIRQFTADASHELRTPVALIRATAELALRRERPAAEYQKSLRDIQSEAERMSELTESLLILARTDANRLEMPLAETDLNEVVREVVRQSDPIAGAKGIVLRADTMERPAVAAANESAIRRLLLTLVDNALKHTPSGGTVTVATAQTSGGVVLSVQDTGEGIQMDALPHIFERFFRTDTARSSGSGVGLGLSIAQAIARAHESVITVESGPGAGARFALVLPT